LSSSRALQKQKNCHNFSFGHPPFFVEESAYRLFSLHLGVIAYFLGLDRRGFMPKEFAIRSANSQDDRRLGELLIDSYVETYAKKLPDVIVSETRKADLRDVASRREHASVLVIERNAEIVGTLTLYPPGSPHSKAWRSDGAEIRYMAVDRGLHGRGLSTLLLNEAKTLAREWNAKCICLHVRQTASGVAGMYMKNGYLRFPEGDRDERPEIFLEAYFLPIEI
jgi:ribosomal protein S18 acetylase RimI-like enzyme